MNRQAKGFVIWWTPDNYAAFLLLAFNLPVAFGQLFVRSHYREVVNFDYNDGICAKAL